MDRSRGVAAPARAGAAGTSRTGARRLILAIALAAVGSWLGPSQADAADGEAGGDPIVSAAPQPAPMDGRHAKARIALDGQLTSGLGWGPAAMTGGNWPVDPLGEFGGALALGLRSGVVTVLGSVRGHGLVYNNQADDLRWVLLGLAGSVVVRTNLPLAGAQTLQEVELGVGATSEFGGDRVLVGPHGRCRFHVLHGLQDGVAVGPTWGADVDLATDSEVGFALPSTQVGVAVEQLLPGRGHLHAEVTLHCLVVSAGCVVGPHFEVQFVLD